jgi:hypothetical protein
MGIPLAYHPATVRQIDHELNRTEPFTGGFRCGCFLSKDKTYILCQFHDGYDSAMLESDDTGDYPQPIKYQETEQDVQSNP